MLRFAGTPDLTATIHQNKSPKTVFFLKNIRISEPFGFQNYLIFRTILILIHPYFRTILISKDHSETQR